MSFYTRILCPTLGNTVSSGRSDPRHKVAKAGGSRTQVSEELRAPSKDTYCDTVRGSHVLNVEAWRVVVRHPGAGQ